jgi:hypothetical protein
MKTLIFTFVSVFLLTNFSQATVDNELTIGLNYNAMAYNNSVTFVENQIEFAVFPDGQFDFAMLGYGSNRALGFSTNAFSFNAGFNFNSYIQYDDFGAVIQIQNTPIFYDHFGRVTHIGNIGIRYNRFGRLIGVGGLNVVFNNNVIVNYAGFINPFNRFYVYRPWHRFYRIPPVNYCVVYQRPYRRFYRPVRYAFYRPYVQNHRYSPVERRRSYAATNGRFRSEVSRRYRQSPRNANERRIAKDYNRRYGTGVAARNEQSRQNSLRNDGRSTRTSRASGNTRTLNRVDSRRSLTTNDYRRTSSEQLYKKNQKAKSLTYRTQKRPSVTNHQRTAHVTNHGSVRTRAESNRSRLKRNENAKRTATRTTVPKRNSRRPN